MAQALSHDSWPWSNRSASLAGAQIVMPNLQLFNDVIHLPFEVIRCQHAEAVHAGFIANSILESRDFERCVDALEHVALGPFARHV